MIATGHCDKCGGYFVNADPPSTVCVCEGRTHATATMHAEIARLKADLARATAERDEARTGVSRIGGVAERLYHECDDLRSCLAASEANAETLKRHVAEYNRRRQAAAAQDMLLVEQALELLAPKVTP